jgi:hypothetical protein
MNRSSNSATVIKRAGTFPLPPLRKPMTMLEIHKAFKSQVSKNIIITNGTSITRNDIFKLKDYFDMLSDKHPTITIKEFTRAMADKVRFPFILINNIAFLKILDLKYNSFTLKKKFSLT